MSEKTQGTPQLDGSVIDQLLDYIDIRIAGGEVPWPLRPQLMAGQNVVALPVGAPGHGAANYALWGVVPPPEAVQGTEAFTALAARRGPQASISHDRIWAELKDALVNFKPRFSKVGPKTVAADLSASGNGQIDVLSATRRSAFFQGLGLELRMHHFKRGATLSDMVTKIGELLAKLGHRVTP